MQRSHLLRRVLAYVHVTANKIVVDLFFERQSQQEIYSYVSMYTVLYVSSAHDVLSAHPLFQPKVGYLSESVDSLCRDGTDTHYPQYLLISKSHITLPQIRYKLIQVFWHPL